MKRYKIALTETTTREEDRTREVRDLLALDLDETQATRLRDLILGWGVKWA